MFSLKIQDGCHDRVEARIILSLCELSVSKFVNVKVGATFSLKAIVMNPGVT